MIPTLIVIPLLRNVFLVLLMTSKDSDFVPGPFETKLTAAKHSPSSPGKNVTPSKSPSDLTAKHAPYDHGGGKGTPAK